MKEKSVVLRDITMKEDNRFELKKSQKTAISVVMSLLVLITAISLVCAFLDLGIIGCIVTLSVFVFVFIKFSIAYSQLRDLGYKSRSIEIFKAVCPIIYAISFMLNVFSI